MSIPLSIWQAQWRSLRNASRYDTKMKIALGVMFVFSAGLGFWWSTRLLEQIQQWQALGAVSVALGMWSIGIQTWLGIALFTILGTHRAISSDEAILLFTLPMSQATRFRALFGSFFLENLWNWFLLQAVVMGYVLISTLGWQAIPWLVLLQLGIIITVLWMLLAIFLFMRYVIPYGSRNTRIAATLILLCLLLLGWYVNVYGLPTMRVMLYWLRPEWASALFVLLFLIMVGPCAGICGSLYSATFSIAQAKNHARVGIPVPGIRLLAAIFSRRRTLLGALWFKVICNQGRNWLFWGRIGVTLVLVALFPLIRGALIPYHISNIMLVIWYTAGVVILHSSEVAVNALSGEANRLTLYLVAPLALTRFLRAKLLLFLLPSLIEGIVIGLFLGWRLGLMLDQIGFVLITVALVIVATITVLVLGSAWDEDLNVVVEGLAQTLMQEEMPITPRRMWLLNFSVLLFVLLVLLVWKVPNVVSVISLIVIDGVIVMGMLRFSYHQIQRLLLKG